MSEKINLGTLIAVDVMFVQHIFVTPELTIRVRLEIFDFVQNF